MRNAAASASDVGDDIAVAAQLACLLEVSASKPGNVSPGHHFVDVRYEDFLVSAAAIGSPFRDAGSQPLGVTVERAMAATARWSGSNTNLGIVLLLAPLARAAFIAHGTSLGGTHISADALRSSLRRVLNETTVDDARAVYASVRRAAPGGLGRVEEQDIADEPSLPLLHTMRLASHRDGIAKEYATDFAVTFDLAAPAIERARAEGLSWDDAAVDAFLAVLSVSPDTHIIRRGGTTLATEVSERARRAMAAGGVRSAAGRALIDEMDRSMRDERNIANPGTTADLTAAALFVVLLGGGWHSHGGLHGATR